MFAEAASTASKRQFQRKPLCYCSHYLVWLVIRHRFHVCIGATPGNRKLCFPSESSKVEFIPMINGFEPMGDCGYDVCGDDIPDEYQVLGRWEAQKYNICPMQL